MVPRLNCVLVFLIAELISCTVRAENSTLSDRNATKCTPVKTFNRRSAQAVTGLCVPYNHQFPKGYCNKLLGSSPIYGKDLQQLQWGEHSLNLWQLAKNFAITARNSSQAHIKDGDDTYTVRMSCLDMVDDVYCHFYFPRCYISSSPQPLCRETCEDLFYNTCDREFVMVKEFMKTTGATDYPFSFNLINCSLLPRRNESSSCYYPDKIRENLNLLEDDNGCYYGDGRGYRGNKSETVSGFKCQPWNESFLHKHDFIKNISSELKDAGNFCRNPEGFATDGPWCYTTNKTVTWDYCCVPKCVPQPPSLPPSNFQGVNTSATSIQVTWGEVPKHSVHGVLLGYHVTCVRFNSSGAEYVVDLDPAKHIWDFYGLDIFVNYSCKVSAYNNFGNGTWSKELIITTDEEKPSASPEYIKAWNLSSTTLRVQWGSVPPGSRRGNILYYKVVLTCTERLNNRNTVRTYYTKARNLTVMGLKKFSKYRITVSASTRRGEGPAQFTTVRTDEDVPGHSPTDIVAFSVQKHVVEVLWDPVPPGFSNGKVLGYKVLYKVANDTSNVNSTRTSADSRSVKIRGLDSNTNYSVQLVAFTAKGDGVRSAAYFVKTIGEPRTVPTERQTKPALTTVVVSSVVSFAAALGGVLLVVYFCRRKRISASSSAESGSTPQAVTPYAVSSPNWLDQFINNPRHGYEELDNENVSTTPRVPRYRNILPDGSLNLPPNMRDMVIEFEQLYENTRYKRLGGRRRSFSGAVDGQGNPMYDELRRVVSPTVSPTGGHYNKAMEDIGTEEIPATAVRYRSIDLSEVRGYVGFFHDNVDRRRRRYSVDLGEVREFIALREVRNSTEEGNTSVTIESDGQD